ncbi:hypothetical protein LINPERHAP1_LOCUS5032 [Linum perenne]
MGMDEMIALVCSPGKKLDKVDQNSNNQSAKVAEKNRDQHNANPNSGNLFIMKIHYDGQFSFIVGEGLGYFGGEVMWCNCLDPEEMSLVVIDSYLVDAGYIEKLQVTRLDAYRRKNGYFYYWKLEKKQLKGGLKKLTSDQDVLDMGASILMVGQVVDVYLSTEASYEEAVMHCDNVHITDQPKKKRSTRRRIDVPEDSDSSGFVDDDNEVSDEETIDVGGFHVEGFTIDTEVMDDADSDYGLSDELNSTCSSDAESGEQGRQKHRDFNKNKEIDDPTFMVGQVFEDFATFKTANRFADYKYIARKYVQRFLIDPYWGIDSIIQTVQEDLHLQIGRDKAGRVRKHGVELAREVGGQLLTAVGLDANDGVYPIAYAAVTTENEDNWKWFLLYLTNDLGIDEESSGDWMIMSDKQKVRHRDKQMVVDLNNQTCTCRKWELSGIPCSHAISCIAFMQDRSENYVHMWYRVENYMKAYGVHISPMVGLESWQKTDRPAIKPPHVNIVGSTKKGRRQTVRRKGPKEAVERQSKQRAYTVKVSRKGTVNKCSICHQPGHKRTWHDTHPEAPTSEATELLKLPHQFKIFNWMEVIKLRELIRDVIGTKLETNY